MDRQTNKFPLRKTTETRNDRAGEGGGVKETETRYKESDQETGTQGEKRQERHRK